MKFKKKDLRKITSATKDELEMLQKEYRVFTENLKTMNNLSLMALSVIGVALIFYFSNVVMDIIGMLIFIYAFYTLANKEGHREGYFDGYYEATHGGKPGMDQVEPSQHHGG